MKKLCLILIASFALVTVLELNKVYAEDGGGIPLSTLAGRYESTVPATEALCLDPMSFMEESCATAGKLVITFSALAQGSATFDQKGNACATFTEVISNLPLDASPPQVSVVHIAATMVNYDPASGTGDEPFTGYSGGKCKGAVFDSTGATVLNTGNLHIVASGGGKRIDGVFTSLTDAVGGVGDFSASAVDLKQ